jgi:hypothetical protein
MVDHPRQAVEPTAVRPDRRSSRRARVRLEAAYEDALRQVFLVTSDLSEGGAFLLTPEPPPVGLSGQITLELPTGPAILRLRGTVVRQRSDHPSGFALAFDPGANPESTRRSLQRFVASAIGEPE